MKSNPSICDYLIKNMKTRGNNIAAKFKKLDQWVTLTWAEYYNVIENAGLGLLELGIKPGDKMALMSNTRVEWAIADHGIMGIGAITVPVYQNAIAEDLEFILNNSEAKMLIIEDKNILKVFRSIQARCPLVEKIICIEKIPSKDQDKMVMDWEEVLALGQQRKQKDSHEFKNRAENIKLSDIATIVYTSGTTGQPKGTVLCHQQAVSEVEDTYPYAGALPSDTSLAFLPFAHIFGRIEHWGQTCIGSTVAYAESIDRLRGNMLDIRPTFLMSVPRIYEKIYSAIWAQASSNVIREKIFRWAVDVGLQVGKYKLKHEPIPVHLVAQYELAKKLALNKVKELFGGNLRFAVSGGAPIAKDMALFFHACEILILEGYGLTETTAAISVNTVFDYKFGSVGKPLGDVQIKIADDGEVLVKSKKVMREYYKNPEATNEVIIDGWFHTGDIGEILPSGDLRITDRKKDLIKTSGGKYVAPQRLEGFLKNHGMIANVLIHGDQEKYIVALITLDKNNLLSYAKDKNISYTDYASLTQHASVLEQVRKYVAEANSHLASFETIKRFAILPQEFSIEAGELTPSMKVKRKFLDKKFKKQIQALYQ